MLPWCHVRALYKMLSCGRVDTLVRGHADMLARCLADMLSGCHAMLSRWHADTCHINMLTRCLAEMLTSGDAAVLICWRRCYTCAYVGTCAMLPCRNIAMLRCLHGMLKRLTCLLAKTSLVQNS